MEFHSAQCVSPGSWVGPPDEEARQQDSECFEEEEVVVVWEVMKA